MLVQGMHSIFQRLLFDFLGTSWFSMLAHGSLGQTFGVPSRFLSQALRWICNEVPCKWQVSSEGRCCDTRGRITLGYGHSSGYYFVKISEKLWPVHILVKRSFHGKPPNAETYIVHHKDGNKANNKLTNLEYVTQSQNMTYFFASSATSKTQPSAMQPIMWRPVGSTGFVTSPSIQLGAKQLGISPRVLSKYCRLNLTIGGYEYAMAAVEQQSLHGEAWKQLIDPKSSQAVEGMLVSSLGRVRFRNGHISSGCRVPQGYARLSVALACRRHRHLYVHQLVVRAFLGPPPTSEHSQINHKDGDKANNAVCNLEYATPRENRTHFLKSADEMGRKKFSTKPVWSRPVGEKEWQWHNSMTSAAATLGLNQSSISRCARGLLKHTGQHEFQLVDPPEPQLLPGETWQEVDIQVMMREREMRKIRLKRL